MKKLIASVIVAIATLVPAVSQAQSYSAAVEKQSRCAAIGELWQESYERDTVLGKPLKHYSKAQEAGKITMDTMMFITMIFIHAPHGEKFRNGREAYMAGWADCMDGR